MSELARCYIDGRGTTVDYAQAMRWARRAADLGDAVAMNTVGLLHDNGQGVPQDNAEAIRWYERAAAAGSETAANNLRIDARSGVEAARVALSCQE
jgi:TPR repeat protein